MADHTRVGLPADLAQSSEVEVRFTPTGDGATRVDLEHRNFERHGAGAETMRTSVSSPGGWGSLLELYAKRAPPSCECRKPSLYRRSSPTYAGIPMKRTTVKLPDDLDAKLRHEAARRQSTVADITREAIEIHVGSRSRRKLLAAKAGRSGTHDTARRIEEIIRAEARKSR